MQVGFGPMNTMRPLQRRHPMLRLLPGSRERQRSIRVFGADDRGRQKYHPQVNRLATRPSFGATSSSSPTSSPNQALEKLLYSYFNWRKDTISDLVLFAFLNVMFVGLVSMIAQAMQFSDSLSLYAIGQILVGQELPEESAVSAPEQVFAFAVGILGLSSFAVVLALVEQAVLEVLEANVRQGSNVIEEAHVVLLSWGTSTRDLAQTVRIVKEICASQQYSWIKDGQLSIVVLSQGREKLEMESLFDGALPEQQRAGCRLVFRQGSPLDPKALGMVSVATSQTVIISGDYSARCRDSDAQVLRSAILVDEMLQSAMEGGTRQDYPRVIVETQTMEGEELLQQWTSPIIRTVNTTRVNAMRTARLLWHPTNSVVSHSLFDHNSTCFIGVCRDPDAKYVGKTIKELQGMFPWATPFGFVNPHTQDESRRFDLNPAADRHLQPGESIVLLQSAERDAATIVDVDDNVGMNDERGRRDHLPWTEERLKKSAAASRVERGPTSASSSGWGLTAGGDGPSTASGSFTSSGSSGSSTASLADSGELATAPCTMLPAAALNSFDYVDEGDADVTNVLITGWPGISYTMELIRGIDNKIGKERRTQDGDATSHILILNGHDPAKIERVLDSLRRELVNTTISHAQCDPRSRYELQRVLPDDQLAKFKGALTLVDVDWFRGDDTYGGEPSSDDFSLSSASMLKMDSLILNCQLNLRQMLNSTVLGPPRDMIFIGERLAGESRCTRFEDRTRLPLGSSINSASFAAKALAQESILAGSMRLYAKVEEHVKLHVVDSSLFAEPGELCTYEQLQARATDMHSTLMGYYDEPDGQTSYVSLTLNPQGWETKREPRVWNSGSGRGRLIIAASPAFHDILSNL